jgi:hypothetical protein
VTAADVRQSIESVVTQKGREADKTKRIVWNLYRRAAPGTETSQSPRNQSGFTEKRPRLEAFESCRWLPLAEPAGNR